MNGLLNLQDSTIVCMLNVYIFVYGLQSVSTTCSVYYSNIIMHVRINKCSNNILCIVCTHASRFWNRLSTKLTPWCSTGCSTGSVAIVHLGIKLRLKFRLQLVHIINCDRDTYYITLFISQLFTKRF